MIQFSKQYNLMDQTNSENTLCLEIKIYEQENDFYHVSLIIADNSLGRLETETFNAKISKLEANTYAYEVKEYNTFNDYLKYLDLQENSNFIEVFQLYQILTLLSHKKALDTLDLDL